MVLGRYQRRTQTSQSSFILILNGVSAIASLQSMISFLFSRNLDQKCRIVSPSNYLMRDRSHASRGLMLPGRYSLWELCPSAYPDLNEALFARAGVCHAWAMLWTHFPRLGTSLAAKDSLLHILLYWTRRCHRRWLFLRWWRRDGWWVGRKIQLLRGLPDLIIHQDLVA